MDLRSLKLLFKWSNLIEITDQPFLKLYGQVFLNPHIINVLLINDIFPVDDN